MSIYTNQVCEVKWGEKKSAQFRVQNGVRQGGVISAIFFSIYIDDLIKILRRSRLGCEIQGVFYGAIVYADDILLMSGSRNGLQSLVDISHRYVRKKNLSFGTHPDPKKSKTV